jgi:imidazolonepropionase-like amidohydrolase
MRRSSIAWTLAATAVLGSPAAAQTNVSPPRNYALTNVRVVTGPGQVIEKGTVIVREGRIAAAGPAVTVPAGVITMDMTGLTVYPGLIDAASALGLPSPPQGFGRGGGGGRGGPAETPEAGPAYEVDSQRAAADVFQPAANQSANLRAAGVTTVGLAFTGGIFPGRVSVIDARDAEPAALVIRTPVAQQIALGRKRNAYPSTLMGALAYIRQAFADARYDARVAAAFQKSPGTTPLPTYDAEHAGLQPAAAGAMPVWIAASRAWDIERVIDLAAGIGVANYAILGGQEAYQVLDKVKASGKPVIVSLDYPAAEQVTGRIWEEHVAPASGPDREKEQLDTAAAKRVRGNAAALSAAGIPFAFASFGLEGPAQFRDRLIGLVEEGLSADEALRAATETPAKLLGLEGAVGSVATGKWANLVVTEGDLFSKDAKIRYVFVEGEKYDIPVAAPRPQGGRGGRGGRGAGPGEAVAAVAAGTWTGSLDAQGTPFGFTLTITGSGNSLTGSMATEMGTTSLTGSQDGPEIVLSGIADVNGQSMTITISGHIEADRMTGYVDASGMGSFPLTARRGPSGAMARLHGGIR